MLPLALLGLRIHLVQDILTELPRSTTSVRTLELLASKFGQGTIAPLTVVLESDRDLRGSEGLALVDDVSRYLRHQRRLIEVRSATQPLGSTELLAPARIDARLGAVDAGFVQLADGAGQLQKGLNEGAARLRAALWLEQKTGLRLSSGLSAANDEAHARAADEPAVDPSNTAPMVLANGLRHASLALLGSGLTSTLKVRENEREVRPAVAPAPAPQPAPATVACRDAR